MSKLTHPIHLVGSVPLADSETAFRTCCEHMGTHLARLPDGETGDRSNWIAWQRAVFAETAQLEPCSDEPTSPFRVRTGVSTADITLPALGYHRAAIDSYTAFQALRGAGIVPKHVRFQVSLPTPLAPV